jgi:hypothetical protein
LGAAKIENFKISQHIFCWIFSDFFIDQFAGIQAQAIHKCAEQNTKPSIFTVIFEGLTGNSICIWHGASKLYFF